MEVQGRDRCTVSDATFAVHDVIADIEQGIKELHEYHGADGHWVVACIFLKTILSATGLVVLVMVVIILIIIIFKI